MSGGMNFVRDYDPPARQNLSYRFLTSHPEDMYLLSEGRVTEV